jgi:outer membrane murein-binding lipoprotein Lpp
MPEGHRRRRRRKRAFGLGSRGETLTVPFWLVIVAVIAPSVLVAGPSLVIAIDAWARADTLQREVARLRGDVADLRGIVGYLLAADASNESGEPGSAQPDPSRSP